MKQIIKLKPRLDLNMTYGIDDLILEQVEIIPSRIIKLLLKIKVNNKSDYQGLKKLDDNIRNALKSYSRIYELIYDFKFDKDMDLKSMSIFLLQYFKIETENNEFFDTIEVETYDSTVYLKTSSSIQSKMIAANKIDKKIKDILEKACNKPVTVSILTKNESIVEKKEEKKSEIKPIIVNFNVNSMMEIEGYIFKIVEKDINTKDGRSLKLVSFYVTDNEKSIICKKFYNNIDYGLKVNDIVKVRGTYIKDFSFDREYYIKVKMIEKIGEYTDEIIDTAPVKRVELGLRTNMSEMYSNIDAKKVTDYIRKIGHSAFAITDLGVVHAYPYAYKDDLDVKQIFGISAYVVDDNKKLVVNPRDVVIEEETYVIFDIETTGFNPYDDKIIEIGAVKVKNLEVVDKFSEFINPEMSIPKNIQELTHISDDDVKDARKIDEVLKDFLEFSKDATMVAHNAKFDIGFIIEKANQLKYDKLNLSYIDTIEWAKFTLKDQKRFNLDALCKRFDIVNESHHRAINDAIVTEKLFMQLLNRIRDMGVRTLVDISEKLQLDIKIAPTKLTTILLKNQKGLSTLYELVSKSFIDYFGKIPRIPKSLLEKNREDLLISSSPNLEYQNEGELVSMYIRGFDKEEIEEAAKFYDFIQVYPEDKYEKEIEKEEIGGIDYVRKMNSYFYELGKKLDKKVVAIGDVCYMSPKEAKSKNILQVANAEFSNFKYNSNSHFRTTDEMLDSFKYLGDEISYEIVVKNTNDIASSIEKIRPIPKGFYPPEIKGAVEEVRKLTYEKAFELYGDNMPHLIKERIERELSAIINNGFAVLYLIAQKLVKKSVDNGYLVGSRGSVGSSIVAYLMGITEVNALAPHYRCKNCKKVELFELEKSGVDLEEKNCAICNIPYIRDGHAIPFEVFMGFNGDKVPDIDLNFSGEFQGQIHKYTEDLFGKDHTFRAGTITTNAFNNAFGYVKKYFEIMNKEKARELYQKVYGDEIDAAKYKEFEKEYFEDEVIKNKAEIERLAGMVEGTRKTTGQHPGGMIVVPQNMSIYDFSPIQKPANDMASQSTTTHFEYHVMDSQLVKLDILGHDDPTTLKNLEDLTKLSPYDIPLTDEAVISLFSSAKALNLKENDFEMDLGTNGIPEFGTTFVKEMLKDTRPKTFTELVRISGLSHGTDVWLNNAQYYVNEGIATLNEIITVRDDIMNYLILQGMDKSLSFKIMEFVRKGMPHKKKDQWEEYKKLMQEAGVKQWYIDSCEKIKYMFPKGHAVAYVMMAVRIAYYKVYYPLEFYTAFLNRKVSSFTLSKAYLPVNKLIERYNELKENVSKNVNEKGEFALLEILIEMHYRGIELLNVDLYKSEAKTFIIENGKIRLPFIVVDKLGDVVANNIVEERNKKPFSSKEDLTRRTGINNTVLGILTDNEVLKNLSETDQQSLF